MFTTVLQLIFLVFVVFIVSGVEVYFIIEHYLEQDYPGDNPHNFFEKFLNSYLGVTVLFIFTILLNSTIVYFLFY